MRLGVLEAVGMGTRHEGMSDRVYWSKKRELERMRTPTKMQKT